jgi:hypothetical protein
MHPKGSPAPPATLNPILWLVLVSLSSWMRRAAIKPTPNPSLRPVFPLSSPLQQPAPKRRRSSFTGILPNHTTPLRFRQPRASSPPPLAPQPDPTQPRPSPSPESPHPEPPLTGAARARPCRRQHAPPPLRPIQVCKSLLLCPLVLVRALVPHVRRPFTGNGGAPPRPSHLPVDSSVSLLSTVRVHHHNIL